MTFPSSMTKPAAGYPRYYAVNDRPVKLVQRDSGVVDAVVFDFATGGWKPDPAYFSKISDGGDVDALAEDAFQQLVAHTRRLSAEKRHAAPIQWTHSGDGEFPYQATVENRALQIRVNDFPAEPLYTLIVDGEDIEDLEDWPSAWKK
jgi:hypothetical protein